MRSVVVLAFVCAAAQFVLGAGVSAPDLCEQDATWDPDLRLTSNSYADFNFWSCQRRIGVDAAGRVHVVWYVMNSGLGTYQFQIFYKRYNPGVGWSQDTMISADLYAASTYSKYPSMAVDSSGRVFVVWANGTIDAAEHSVYYKSCMPTGNGNGGWDLTSTLVSTNPSTYLKECPNVCCTPNGNVQVVWIERTPSPVYRYVAFRERVGTTWQPLVALESTTVYKVYPAVAGSHDNNVHVTWHGYEPSGSGYYEVWYKARISGTWGAVENASDGARHQMYPSIACNPVTNQPHLVWQGAGAVSTTYRAIHKYRTSGGWQPADTLSEPGSTYNQGTAQIEFTPNGLGHALWEGRSGSSPTVDQVRYAERSAAGTWSAPFDLTDTTNSRDRPSIANGGRSSAPNDLHVSWTDYRDGNSEVYYKHGSPGITHDVGVSVILAPAGIVDSGSTVAPACSVFNYGSSTESYRVRMRIGTGYNDTARAENHGPGTAAYVAFPAWTATVLGLQAVVCSTELAGDGQPANDKDTGSVEVRRPQVEDVGVTAIEAPVGVYDTNEAVAPSASVRNFGDVVASFRTWFVIEDSASVELYREYVDVAGLAPDAETTVAFPVWPGTSVEGRYGTLCSLAVSDDNPANDTMTGRFEVEAGQPPPGWLEVASMPPGSRPVKDGAWLAYSEGNGLVYAAKGYKTEEFYQYDPGADSWTRLADIPEGPDQRLPYKGSRGVCVGDDYVYMTKGNNTLEFWCYDIGADSWIQKDDVPLGWSGKRVKGGTDMVYAKVRSEPGYVYLLKGYCTEFRRFGVETGVWDSLPDAPAGSRPRWGNGSWLVYHGRPGHDEYEIYAHKAKYHELWKYDIGLRSWQTEQLSGMPLVGMMGRRKSSKDGGSAAWYDGEIYALKGGNTQEFWKYTPETDSWQELDTMPVLGSTGKKKRVKAGGDIVSGEARFFYALKGNKTVEFWRYLLPAAYGSQLTANRFGVMAGVGSDACCVMRIGPNPLTSGVATLSWVSGAGRDAYGVVRIYDVTGREVLRRTFVAGRRESVALDLGGLGAGVYLVRLSSSGLTATRRLVVSR